MKRILCFGWLSERISVLPGFHTLPFPSYTNFLSNSPAYKSLSRFRLSTITIIYFAFSMYIISLFRPFVFDASYLCCNACTKKS